MEHSMLITGKNQTIKKELFAQFWTDFECFTCSSNHEDIKNHLKRFVPDIMVYCLQEEASDVQSIIELQELLKNKEIVLVVAGSKEDCDFFVSCVPKLAKFVFEKPLNTDMIASCLIEYMEKRDMDDLLNQIDTFSAPKRIMVIDDDPFMLKLMTEYLKNDYDVMTATGGKPAIEQMMKKTADLILLDYEMPDEAGPKVLENLHQNKATQDIPVIFLTSIMQRELIEKALLLKPQGYLLKPVSQEKLLEAIKNLLG